MAAFGTLTEKKTVLWSSDRAVLEKFVDVKLTEHDRARIKGHTLVKRKQDRMEHAYILLRQKLLHTQLSQDERGFTRVTGDTRALARSQMLVCTNVKKHMM